jgi:3-(3-hydroxy-phenyl)propionate hydroxylase
VKELDVLISGMGPTGATLAGLLGQRGLRVAVFDRLPDLYPLPRAIGMDHEVMRVLQELGVAERMAPHIASYRPSEYRGMDGQLIKRLDAAPSARTPTTRGPTSSCPVTASPRAMSRHS